ncbi:MAG: DUF3943 domain-containing protein [Bacteroidales bacterium]|jgi:hypothetical protein
MKIKFILFILFIFPELITAHLTKKIQKKIFEQNTEWKYQLCANEKNIHSPIASELLGNTFACDSAKINNIKLSDTDSCNKKRHYLFNLTIGNAESFVISWSFSKYFLKEKNANIGFVSWGNNLRSRWQWDSDRFGNSFFVLPFSTSAYYNAARPIGFSYFESMPFPVVGSFMWEYFGRTSRPSYNDIIYAPINATFIGEIFYRLSSSILDERTKGAERVFKEIIGGILDPSMALSRLIKGNTFRISKEDNFQKEPLIASFLGGFNEINNGKKIGTGKVIEMLSFHFDYGNPFEDRYRKPFDFFKLNFDFTNENNRLRLNIVSGYGLLFGKNVQCDKKEMLVGVFQHYDFYSSNIYKISAMALNVGIISKLPIFKKIKFNADFHFGIVPFGGNCKTFGIDTSKIRATNYGGGLETKLDCSIDFADVVNVKFVGNYFWMNSYVGNAENYLIGVVHPSISIKLYRNIHLGFEHFLYCSKNYTHSIHNIIFRNSEQKFFLSYHLNYSEESK